MESSGGAGGCPAPSLIQTDPSGSMGGTGERQMVQDTAWAPLDLHGRGWNAFPAVGSTRALARAVGSSKAAAGSSEGRKQRALEAADGTSGHSGPNAYRWHYFSQPGTAEELLRTQTRHHSTGKEPLAFLLPSQAHTQLKGPPAPHLSCFAHHPPCHTG